jgi:multidrug efflux pump subunit AcrA (membrane-fusion protein)
MFPTSVLLALALAAQPEGAAGDPHIPNCVIHSIDDQFVPASEPGRLMNLNVYEGMHVTKDMEIGKIDTSEAAANLKIKQYELDVAKQAANSEVDIKHAQAAYGVAFYNLARYQEANKKVPGSVSDVDMKHHEFEKKKAEPAIQQTMEKQPEAKLTAKAKEAEVEAAGDALKRRSLLAPFDGVIVRLEKKEQEWVAAGEPVAQIVGVKRLHVKGDLNANEWSPADVANRKVTVEVTLPRGRTVKVPGKVTYVSPVVQIERFDVWAEIESPMDENGMPVVRAGLPGTMTIHVGEPVAETPTEAPVRSTSTRRPAN